MARSARNYELAIAALAGALAMVTLLFLWERSSIEAAAKAVETSRADRSGRLARHEPRWSYWPALGLLPPDQQGLDDEIGPIESDSPYDVFSPYLHNVPTSRPATASAAPHPTRTASLTPMAPKPSKSSKSPETTASDFLLPDVSSLLIPAASLAMLAIPLAELERARYGDIMIWSPPLAPSGDPAGFGGPFHLFFTTDSPTGVAPVAESGGGGGSTASTLTSVTSEVSSTTSNVTGLAASTTSSLTGLAASTTSAATGLVSSTTSTATGLVSSVLRRH